jgi:hypothetical protein
MEDTTTADVIIQIKVLLKQIHLLNRTAAVTTARGEAAASEVRLKARSAVKLNEIEVGKCIDSNI